MLFHIYDLDFDKNNKQEVKILDNVKIIYILIRCLKYELIIIIKHP